jgi:hypothetical protein
MLWRREKFLPLPVLKLDYLATQPVADHCSNLALTVKGYFIIIFGNY